MSEIIETRLKDKHVKKITEILEEDSVAKTGNILSRNPINKSYNIYSFIITCVLFVVSIFSIKYLREPKLSIRSIISEISMFSFIFAAVNTLLLYYIITKNPRGDSKCFASYVVQNNINLFRITLSIGIFTLILLISSWVQAITSPMILVPATDSQKVVENNLIKDKNESDSSNNTNGDSDSETEKEKKMKNKLIYRNYLETRYESILCAFFVFFASWLIKNIFLQFINHRIHFKYYKERIRENQKIVQYLQSLNDVTEDEPERNVEEFNRKIFDAMKTSEDDILEKKDFIRHFGTHDGKNIFFLFDIDENSVVTRDEFSKRYRSLLKEKELLDVALHSNSSSMAKLNIIFSLIMYPLSFVIILFHLDAYSKFENIFKFISALCISFSFAFSALVSTTFQSIVFVFFVRPFDIGDVIEFDGKTFLVSDLGLLYSTFICDSMYEIVPNEILRNKTIKNFRKSTHVTCNFKYSAHEKDFQVIQTDLKDKIRNFLQENSKKYHEHFKIHKIEQLDQENVQFEIEIIVSCPYQETHTVEQRKDNFTLFLMKITGELGIKMKKA